MKALKNQLTFNNFMGNFDELTNEATTKLFHLFNLYIDIDSLIPTSFRQDYYSAVGSPKKYSLSSMIKFFILKNILAISESKQLLHILHLSKDIRISVALAKYLMSLKFLDLILITLINLTKYFIT